MCTSIFSALSQSVFGCLNALMGPDWKQFSKKPIFAGLFWTRTECCLENRDRSARFMGRAIRQPDPPLSRATVIQAGRSGVRGEVTLGTRRIANFIVTSVSTFRSNIWGQSRAATGNSR